MSICRCVVSPAPRAALDDDADNALFRRYASFPGWSGGAQQDRTVLGLSAFNGDIPRGVAKSVLLHKGGVMLLIDNDDSGLVEAAQRPRSACQG